MKTLQEVFADMDRGSLAAAEHDARYRAAMEAERASMARYRRAETAEVLRKLDLPIRSIEAIATGVQPTAALDALADVSGVVVLSGNPGCGKTVAAANWLRSMVLDDAHWGANGLGVKFTGGPLFFVTATRIARWQRYNDEEMRKLIRASRLVIDDMGTEYLDDKGVYLSTIDEIINERHAHRRPTVITTNLDATAFKARYGERITDRLREGGRFVSLGGRSLRGQK